MCVQTHILHHIKVWAQHRVHRPVGPRVCPFCTLVRSIFAREINRVRAFTHPCSPQKFSRAWADARAYSWCTPPRIDLARTVYDSRRRWRELEYE